MDTATCFFIIGSNTSECHPVLFRRLAARKQADPSVKVIVVDPRLTNTARIADLFLPVIPGTDLALLNAMLGKTNQDYGAPFYGVPTPLLIDYARGAATLTEGRYAVASLEQDEIIAEVTLPALPGGPRHGFQCID